MAKLRVKCSTGMIRFSCLPKLKTALLGGCEWNVQPYGSPNFDF